MNAKVFAGENSNGSMTKAVEAAESHMKSWLQGRNVEIVSTETRAVMSRGQGNHTHYCCTITIVYK